jgi:hypothetical protein
MSKRFVDTELWQKEWYQDLSLKEKILVKYIFENCDCAGVWNGNFRMASFIIGESVTVDDLRSINQKKKQFDILGNGIIFVPDFIKFQYGTLSENCKPHKPVIEKLKKYGLYERVWKGYSKGIETLEEKEQEQDKEKDINLYGIYNNVTLSKDNYNKFLGICANRKLFDELIDAFSENIETGKEEPYRADFPNAHFVRLKAYYDYRRKYPDRFKEPEPKTSQAFNDFYEREKARMKAEGYIVD